MCRVSITQEAGRIWILPCHPGSQGALATEGRALMLSHSSVTGARLKVSIPPARYASPSLVHLEIAQSATEDTVRNSRLVCKAFSGARAQSPASLGPYALGELSCQQHLPPILDAELLCDQRSLSPSSGIRPHHYGARTLPFTPPQQPACSPPSSCLLSVLSLGSSYLQERITASN